ncbi:Bgt-242 [Blumeria graminis f. sp. tritici]|uniref:Bgt-242 n=3 Tax=Blumeria graminis f. sp. tritici TaxID=62690 RepID=A0A9X9MKN2_BLUGR|nr:Bgt-242 [Blumeria graminis f. sp. tritici]
MAQHAYEFDTEEIKEKARKDILYLLEGVRGKKNLVLERSLAGPIGSFVKFTNLQDYGVDKIFFLENQNADVSQRNVVFIARGENARLVQLIAEKVLEEAGVLGDTNVSEFPLYFVPMEKDILSLELEESFADLYLRKVYAPTFMMARSLMIIQQKYGYFPRITGKGDKARKLADLLSRMRQELVASEDSSDEITPGLFPSATIESLIIIDREVDYATPLLTQLTYNGLIDEVFGIQNNQVEVDSSIICSTPQPLPGAPAQSKQQKLSLHSSDKLFHQLRDENFATVGKSLNSVARRLQSEYDSRHTTKTTAELRDFVNKLPAYQVEQQSLKIHTNLAEEIMKHTQTEEFTKILEIQQNLAAGCDPSTQHESIEELISKNAPLSQVLRLLCLESCISGGIKSRDLEEFKKMILHAYGYQHILTLSALEKAQLLLSRSSPLAVMIPMSGSNSSVGTKTNYTYLRKALRLIVDEVNESDPDDVAYVYSGYAPLSVRLIQSILQKQYLSSLARESSINDTVTPKLGTMPQKFTGFEEAIKHIRGETFDEIQKFSSKVALAREMFTSNVEKKVVFVVFLGGITYAEIAALRFICRKEESKQMRPQ